MSTVSWDVLREEGGDQFSSAEEVGGVGRLRQINEDEQSCECDGLEATDINNAGRHRPQCCSSFLIPYFTIENMTG